MFTEVPVLDLGPIGYRVEGFFQNFGGDDFGWMQNFPIPPLFPFFPGLDTGFGIGRRFFGSGLLTGLPDFPLFGGGDPVARDVNVAANALLGWGDIFDYDPLFRSGVQTFLPFPILNAFVPAPPSAVPAAAAESSPRGKESERPDEDSVRRIMREEEAARLKAQEEERAKQEKAIAQQEEAQKAERAAKEAELKKLLGGIGGGGGGGGGRIESEKQRKYREIYEEEQRASEKSPKK